MNRKLRNIGSLYHFYKVWRWLSWLLFIPGIVGILVSLIKIFSWNPTPGWIAPIWLLGFTLISFWLIIGFVWLLVVSWYSLTFRNLAWWFCQMIGRLRKGISTGWVGILILFAALIVFLWLREALLGQGENRLKIHGDQALQVFAAVSIMILLYAGLKSRKRIIITAFTDYTDNSEAGKNASGLASYLTDRLAYLVNIYQIIDEASPILSQDAIQATMNVLDYGQLLKDTISSETKIKLVGIDVPIGSLVSLMGKLVQGPELTGSIHKDRDTLVLQAHLSGGGRSERWRVLSTDLEHPDDSLKELPIHLMLDQLAHRIFTDLVDVGSKKWRAVKHYTEGLYWYRRTLRAKGERIPRLRSAEKAFLLALADDVEFAQCHYNLGIVYRDLKQQDSAVAAYRQTIAQDPAHYDACYALASELVPDFPSASLEKYEETIRLCDYLINLRPEDPRGWHLKNVNLLLWATKLNQQNTSIEEDLPKDNPLWHRSIFPSYYFSAGLAWQQLCLSALRGTLTPKVKHNAVLTVHNLAVYHIIVKQYREGVNLFHQALKIVPKYNRSRITLAQFFSATKQWQAIISELDRVLEQSLDIGERAQYAVYLAKAHAALYCSANDREGKKWHMDGYQRACNHYLDCVASSDPDVRMNVLSKVSNLYVQDDFTVTDDTQKKSRVALGESINRLRQRFLNPKKDNYIQPKKVTDIQKENEESAKKLGEKLGKLEKFYEWLNSTDGKSQLPEGYTATWPWASAQVSIRDAFKAEQQKNWMEAKEAWINAITSLRVEHQQQIHAQSLYGRLADCEAMLGELTLALGHAKYAVDLEPESAWDRWILGKVYFALENIERANAEWDIALSIAPDDLDIIKNIINTWTSHKVFFRDPESRNIAFQHLADLLGKALKSWITPPVIFERNTVSIKGWEEQINNFGWLNFWLGRFYYELIKLDLAIYHLRIAKQCGFASLESLIALSDSYLEDKAYGEAENSAREAVREVKRQKIGRHIGLYQEYDSDLGEKFRLADWLVMAHLNLSRTRIERGSQLKWAKQQLNHAYYWTKNGTEWQTQNLVDYYNCWGLIYIREGNLKGAISKLQEAKNKLTDPYTEFLLVDAYRQQAKLDPGLADKWLERARQSACSLRIIDLRRLYYNDEINTFLGDK